MKISYKIAFTSLLGNLIEYFGFTLFAIFAKEIGQSFFPELDSFAQVISVFIIFGTGFLSRPIGAVFFGHFGDKVGRKKSLSYTRSFPIDFLLIMIKRCIQGIEAYL